MALSLSLSLSSTWRPSESEELRFRFVFILRISSIFYRFLLSCYPFNTFFFFEIGSEPIKEGPVRGRGHSDTNPSGGRNREEKDGGKEQENKSGQARRGGKGSGTSEQRKKKRASERGLFDIKASPL